jgi:hypothetical protein
VQINMKCATVFLIAKNLLSYFYIGYLYNDNGNVDKTIILLLTFFIKSLSNDSSSKNPVCADKSGNEK